MQPWEIPVPPSEDGDLSDTCLTIPDEWIIHGDQVIRKHHNFRLNLFSPTNVDPCPVPTEWLMPERQNTMTTRQRTSWTWKNNIQAHQCMPTAWTGETSFKIQPQYTSNANQETLHQYLSTRSRYRPQLNNDEITTCMRQGTAEQIAFLASTVKHQRAEVKERNLSAAELKLFNEPKAKEICSWLSTETVRKIARNQILEEQILRSRWVLTWKPVEPTTSDPSPPSKPKARLVILGYEDPQLESLARDSPTMGKDSRTLILQYAASTKQRIRSFDIQSAYKRQQTRWSYPGNGPTSRNASHDEPPTLGMLRIAKECIWPSKCTTSVV